MWGSIIGGVLGAAGNSGSKTQSQDTTRQPWANAAPWLQKSVDRGSQLQDFYQQNPFSPAQQQAYGNQFALSDNYRATMPQLMQTMSNQGGFDRNNPTARAPSFNFTPPQGGNLGFGNPFANMAPTGPAPASYTPTPPGTPRGRLNIFDPLNLNNQVFDPFNFNAMIG